MKEEKIAIVGGGVAGMVLAKRLVDKGFVVTIFEKNKKLGGLMSGFKIEKVYLEKTYHHIFSTDKAIIELIDELGLSQKLAWLDSSVAVVDQKQKQAFNGGLDLLNFKGLSLLDKLRLGLVAVWLKQDKNWAKYENISAEKWLKKYVGAGAYKVIWEPLLKGKFGSWYKQVSMAWLWARIHVRTNSSKLGQGEKLGYLKAGFEQIIKKLEKELKQKGVVIKKGVEVKSINNLTKNFDKVIWTGSNLSLAKIIKDKKLKQRLGKTKYLDFVNLVFASSQNLSNFYWHNINDLKSPFLALVEHSNLIGTDDYKGNHIYYAGSYRQKVIGSNKEIKKQMFDYLAKLYPDFDLKKVQWAKIYKFKQAQHLVTTGYKAIRYKIGPKLYLANFSQIYPYDRGINYSVDLANKIARIVSC